MKTTAKLWIGIGILILLSPLGLVLPEHFKAGDAWGEWGTDGIKELAGYIPQGLEKLSSLWNAPIPDYAFKGWEEKGLGSLSLAYIASAIIGILITVCVVLLIGKLLSRKE
jgi:hypothetical protein